MLDIIMNLENKKESAIKRVRGIQDSRKRVLIDATMRKKPGIP